MEHVYCFCCHKQLRPGRDDHPYYCAECVTEASRYVDQLEVPEHCTICTNATCHRCPNEATRLTADELAPDWRQPCAPGEEQMHLDDLPF